MRLLIPAVPFALCAKWTPAEPADAMPPRLFGIQLCESYDPRTFGWFAVLEMGVRSLTVWAEVTPSPPKR